VGVSLAISKDLGGVGWGVLEVSGVGFFGVACIVCARAREGFPIAAPVPWSRNHRGIMACESAVPFRATPCHCATSIGFPRGVVKKFSPYRSRRVRTSVLPYLRLTFAFLRRLRLSKSDSIQPVAGTVARRRNPAGFSLAFATRRATLTGEPFDPFFDTSGISEPNRAAHRCSKRL
jgi:hypothetical protein